METKIKQPQKVKDIINYIEEYFIHKFSADKPIVAAHCGKRKTRMWENNAKQSNSNVFIVHEYRWTKLVRSSDEIRWFGPNQCDCRLYVEKCSIIFAETESATSAKTQQRLLRLNWTTQHSFIYFIIFVSLRAVVWWHLYSATCNYTSAASSK